MLRRPSLEVPHLLKFLWSTTVPAPCPSVSLYTRHFWTRIWSTILRLNQWVGSCREQNTKKRKIKIHFKNDLIYLLPLLTSDLDSDFGGVIGVIQSWDEKNATQICLCSYANNATILRNIAEKIYFHIA